VVMNPYMFRWRNYIRYITVRWQAAVSSIVMANGSGSNALAAAVMGWRRGGIRQALAASAFGAASNQRSAMAKRHICPYVLVRSYNCYSNLSSIR